MTLQLVMRCVMARGSRLLLRAGYVDHDKKRGAALAEVRLNKAALTSPNRSDRHTPIIALHGDSTRGLPSPKCCPEDPTLSVYGRLGQEIKVLARLVSLPLTCGCIGWPCRSCVESEMTVSTMKRFRLTCVSRTHLRLTVISRICKYYAPSNRLPPRPRSLDPLRLSPVLVPS